MCEYTYLRNTLTFLLLGSIIFYSETFCNVRTLKSFCLQMPTFAFLHLSLVLVLVYISILPIHLSSFLCLHLEEGLLQDGA